MLELCGRCFLFIASREASGQKKSLGQGLWKGEILVSACSLPGGRSPLSLGGMCVGVWIGG